MIVATIHVLDDEGQDQILGTVSLKDGVAVPSDDDFFPLRNIAEEVNAATDKEAAMKALPNEYSSAYMRASVETDKTRGATHEDPEMNRESEAAAKASEKRSAPPVAKSRKPKRRPSS